MELIDFYKKNKVAFNITINGECMDPIIKDGDIVTIKPLECYEINDIIFCIDNNGFKYIHRIVKIEDGYIYTKADNNLCIDKCALTLNDIYGKAII